MICHKWQTTFKLSGFKNILGLQKLIRCVGALPLSFKQVLMRNLIARLYVMPNGCKYLFISINLNFFVLKFSIPRISIVALIAFNALSSFKLDPSNPPTAKTGAPGEMTCGQSGCHTGGTFTGTVSISGIPDTLELNKTYSVTLTQSSNASLAGFQLTCLDGNNARCGTLTATSGTNVASVSSTGRQYIRQSTAKSLSGGSVSWTFNWKSPAAVPANNNITYYFVSLAANGTGGKTGDNVLQANKKAVFKTTTSPSVEASVLPVKFYADPARRSLDIQLESLDNADLKIFDMAGNLVLEQKLTMQNQVMLGDLSSGVFVAQISAEGRKAIKKFAL